MKLPLTLFLLALPMASLAHSGGTNSDGCHTNHSTGEYHCDHGGRKALETDAQAPGEVPVHWSKDVGVKAAPRVHTPAYTCPVGTISSNLIIDGHRPVCAASGIALVKPACNLALCNKPVVAAKARPKVDPSKHSFYFKNCEEAFTAQRAPLHRGDDGYRAELDEDGDGLACDPLVTW